MAIPTQPIRLAMSSTSSALPSEASSIDLYSYVGPAHVTPAGFLTTFKIVEENVEKVSSPEICTMITKHGPCIVFISLSSGID